MAPKKVLVVLTSCGQMNNGHPTGWYLPEFAHPYYDFLGPDPSSPKVEIVVVSPKGGEAPLDQSSVEAFAKDPESTKFHSEQQKLWKETKTIKEFLGRASEFDGVFYPGGHGPMFDLVKDEDSIKLIEEFYTAGKPVSAVCHGPIVFINAKADGKPLLAGRTATGFSNVEEEQAGLTKEMPELLEDAIKRVGGSYVKADEPWGEKAVVDGLVITGQNPASAHAVGKKLMEAIGA